MGLRGFFDTEADFLLPIRPGKPPLPAVPFVPRPHPGNKPVLVANPTDAQRANYKHRVILWKDAMADFNGEQQLYVAAKIKLCNSMPSYLLAEARDPIHGFRNRTMLYLRQHLNLTFLILSPTDILTNLCLLEVPYNPANPLPELIGLHRDVSAMQTANNSPIPMTRRFWYIVNSITHCGLYAELIANYTMVNTTALTQLFDTFVVALMAYERNRRHTTTAKAAGYAAAVVLGPPAAAPLALPAPAPALAPAPVTLDSLAAAVSSMQSLLQGHFGGGGGGGGGGGAGKGKGKNKKGKKKDPLYCWTHGCLGHASPACLNKNPGHDDLATYSNQLGGKKA